MKRGRNASCIYTGLVGTRLRPPNFLPRQSKRGPAMRFKCQNGPFANHKLFLGKEGRGYTFEFTIYNITGYYRFGEWHEIPPRI